MVAYRQIIFPFFLLLSAVSAGWWGEVKRVAKQVEKQGSQALGGKEKWKRETKRVLRQVGEVLDGAEFQYNNGNTNVEISGKVGGHHGKVSSDDIKKAYETVEEVLQQF